MELLERYLNRPFECNCGRTHFVPMRRICTDMWSTDLSAEFETLLGGKRAVMLCDAHTKEAINDRLAAYLKEQGWELTIREYNSEGPLFNDETVVGTAVFAVTPKTDGIIAVGGGTITDLGRFVGSRLGKPFVLVMTCPSMDGYGSDVAGMLIGGKKKVLKDCTFPQGLFADLEVLRTAPWDLIKSGFGDMLGKRTALPDWILARHVDGAYYCPLIADIVDKTSQACLDCLDGIVARDQESIRTLIDALCLTGVNMALCSDTRPASGSEHIFSHYLVESAIDQGRPAPSHGTTVAFGTLVSSLLYEYLLGPAMPEELAPIQEELKRYLPASDDVRKMLEKTGIGAAVTDHLPDKETLAHMIRVSCAPEKRYTVLRYLSDCDILKKAIQYVLEHID